MRSNLRSTEPSFLWNFMLPAFIGGTWPHLVTVLVCGALMINYGRHLGKRVRSLDKWEPIK